MHGQAADRGCPTPDLAAIRLAERPEVGRSIYMAHAAATAIDDLFYSPKESAAGLLLGQRLDP